MNFHKTTFIILLLFCFSNKVSSQTVDSSEYKQFKRILPFVIKSINENIETKSLEAERVQESEFIAPWELSPFDQSEIEVFLNKLKSDCVFETKEARGDYVNLNIYTTFQNFREEPKLKKEFENLIIEISNFDIVNENNEDIYLADKANILQPKLNGRQQVTMQGAQFNTLIPISKNHSNVSGSVEVMIKQKSEFIHQEFSKDDTPMSTEINGVAIDLVQLTGNQAIFRSATKLNDLKLISVNGDNKKHKQSSLTQLPEKIYLKAIEESLSEDDITEFVQAYSMEQFNNKHNEPTMIIYESSGNIAKVYMYQVSKEEERGKCVLNIKL